MDTNASTNDPRNLSERTKAQLARLDTALHAANQIKKLVHKTDKRPISELGTTALDELIAVATNLINDLQVLKTTIGERTN